jgi:hypothetical protein
MTTNSTRDALEVLRQVYTELRPTAPWELILQCYEVERRYQFDVDRELALSQLRAAVTHSVGQELESDQNTGGPGQ